MLKWIKVRQNTSATTSASTTPTLSGSHREAKDDETRVEAEVKKKEEGEDSGLEREDSICNIELSDLKKVRFIDLFSNLELI